MPKYTVSGYFTETVEADDAEEAINYACDKIGNGWHWEAEEVTDAPAGNLVRFTADDAAVLLGRPITGTEYDNLVKALEFSSMTEAFTEVVHEVCGYPDEEGTHE
jgi:hypothetical protein